jgi:hypothetical protein
MFPLFMSYPLEVLNVFAALLARSYGFAQASYSDSIMLIPERYDRTEGGRVIFREMEPPPRILGRYVKLIGDNIFLVWETALVLEFWFEGYRRVTRHRVVTTRVGFKRGDSDVDWEYDDDA